jgi:hypothetical protein
MGLKDHVVCLVTKQEKYFCKGKLADFEDKKSNIISQSPLDSCYSSKYQRN